MLHRINNDTMCHKHRQVGLPDIGAVIKNRCRHNLVKLINGR